MEFTAQQIAEMLQGKIEGDPKVAVNNVSKIEEGKPQTLSFLANPKYTEHIYTTGASIVIVNNDFKAEKAIPKTCTLIRVKDAYRSFAQLLETYNSIKFNKEGISDNSVIDKTSKIGSGCYIADHVFIGAIVVIGDNTMLYPGVYLGDNVSVGD